MLRIAEVACSTGLLHLVSHTVWEVHPIFSTIIWVGADLRHLAVSPQMKYTASSL